MFHKAVKLEFDEGTALVLTFQDGKVKRFDMGVLFDKYPQLTALRDRKLFTSGQLMGFYGIIWNEELDIEAETIYEEGETVRVEKPAVGISEMLCLRQEQKRDCPKKLCRRLPESTSLIFQR
jgi:hypothetical protein